MSFTAWYFSLAVAFSLSYSASITGVCCFFRALCCAVRSARLWFYSLGRWVVCWGFCSTERRYKRKLERPRSRDQPFSGPCRHARVQLKFQACSPCVCAGNALITSAVWALRFLRFAFPHVSCLFWRSAGRSHSTWEPTFLGTIPPCWRGAIES